MGPSSRPTWAAFDCPCKLKHRIMLNLSTDRRPTWRLSGKRSVTLSPSIDAWTGHIRCHFWVKDGQIKWVTERTEASHGG